jgi:II/X family phage/plasmid replication protein
MTTMIDWVTARVPLASDGLINGGFFVSIDVLGDVEYRTDKRLLLEGSHESRIAVRGGMGVLEFSGNPAKFLQGHNLFGPAELVPLMERCLHLVADKLGLRPSVYDRIAWFRGNYDLSRVDIARMVDCGSPGRVRKVLDALGLVARKKYQARSVVGSGTVYIGKGSRRQVLKFYDKGYEIRQKGHELSATLAPIWHQRLTEFAAGKLRAEVKIGSKWFHENPGYRLAGFWNEGLAASVLDSQLMALEVSDTMRLPDDVIAGLPPKLVPVYDAWRNGRDIRAIYSRPTFYRYRRQLLDLAGIDIALTQPRAIVAEAQYIAGFPLRELLCGPGVPVPDWAKGTTLLASKGTALLAS